MRMLLAPTVEISFQPPNSSMDDRLKLLGRIAAGVAHDLSNYLWIADLSLLKLERRAQEADLGTAAHAAREATQRALQLSTCLLAYARGGAPLPVAVDLGELVRRVLLLFRPLIPDTVEVVVSSPEDAPLIDGIEPELEQLLLNLVLNSCDAMPQGGTLEIAVGADEVSVFLEVRNSGRSPNGCGLGFEIVRGVAERHDATIEMAVSPSGGASFVVSFPRRSSR
jgi:two-component system, cell cycle sensor histidine kinase and response regulator CckA